ncbi:hypothetical protein [Paenibacillus oralis]|uniref:Uncharacterized protein n=1 Tax=Paenibacillus oralis TaxID=2490856 RepID=A0A3P3U6K7_9BACL|nr:hypothetical protein [Paenibacillus oralis]RRJ65850.1 hypothetical protein EHV15_25215 [Paenibacillus oralis]
MAVTAKSGKYFYAWSKVLADGSFYLPDQALQEYGIHPDSNIILMTGRNTVRGFSVVCKEMIANSPLAAVFASIPQLRQFAVPEGETITFKERTFCWVHLNCNRYFTLPPGTWEQFGLKPGDRLLSLRATHLAFNNLLEGPFIEQAKQIPDLTAYG